MSASVGTEAGAELARSLDESLGKIIATEALLEVTGEDRPLGDEVLAEVRALGIDLIGLAEEEGGLGIDVGGRLPLAAVFGRRLVPAALRDEAFGLAPALAALSLADPADEALASWLERVVGGELSGAVALAGREGRPAAVVPGGAEVLVVLGTEELSLYALGGGDAAVVVEPFEGLDAGQGMSWLDLSAAEPLAGLAGPGAAAIRREYELMLVCEAFGAGERCLEMAVDYARERRQFGQEIAGFQAVAHLLAGAKLGIEISRAGIGRYVDLAGEDDVGEAALEQHLAVLRHSLPAAAREACETSIQVHGGIGFSWELGLHLFYRRILAVQYLLGGEGQSAELVGAAYITRRQG